MNEFELIKRIENKQAQEHEWEQAMQESKQASKEWEEAMAKWKEAIKKIGIQELE